MWNVVRPLVFSLLLIIWSAPTSAADLTLEWDPPSDGLTAAYVLFVGTEPGSYSRQIEVGAGTSYRVQGLTAGVTYYFTVRARSRDGALSAPSAEVSGAPPGGAGASSGPDDSSVDESPSLLFQSTNGDLYRWLMRGTTLGSGRWLSPARLDSSWSVVGTPDLTGDDQDDLLVQHQKTGQVTLLKMNGLAVVGEQPIPIAKNSPWAVVATGDFNLDGHSDIAWQHSSSRQIYLWFMQPGNGRAGYAGEGGSFSGDYVRDRAGRIVTPGAGHWRVVGAADLDLDGTLDLVWQDLKVGKLRAWFLDGASRTSDVSLTPGLVDPTWRVRALADYNQDGRPDLVWQNLTTGDLYVWFMNGTRLTTGAYLNPSRITKVWRIVGK